VAGNNNCSNITKSTDRKSQLNSHQKPKLTQQQCDNKPTNSNNMTARKVVSAKQKYKTKPARLNLKLGNKPILWAELKARQKSCVQSHARKYPPYQDSRSCSRNLVYRSGTFVGTADPIAVKHVCLLNV